MPPPGYEPFLRAICADPEDDTVRLVYADWLDENGDPARAEFIRLQIAQDGKPWNAENHAWFQRTAELLGANRKLWGAELPKLKGIIWGDVFRRGFVETVTVQAGKWLLAHQVPVFASTPVQSIALADAGQGTLEKVSLLPQWERVRELQLTNCRVAPGRFRVISYCPALTRLRTLGVHRNAAYGWNARAVLTNEEADELAKTPHLPLLERISLGGSVSSHAAAILRTRCKVVRHGVLLS